MKDINYDVLCEMIAQELIGDSSKETVKRYLRATYKVILKQLKLKNRVYFKDFGYWEIKQRKSGEREINDPKTREKRLIYVKPKYSIFFKSSLNFDLAVNENDFNIINKNSEKKIKREVKMKDKKMNSADLINLANSRKG